MLLQYLIKRPIGILMTTLAIVIVSLVFIRNIAISLLPDIPVPHITVKVSASHLDARTLENTATKIIRNQLLQVEHLYDITSSTRNGSATINLVMDHGIDMSLAQIEVNEKLDQIMTYLPKDLERPRVILSNISDTPVFFLNIRANDTQRISHLELSHFVKNTIKRRVEQLDEVALADINGYTAPQIIISPYKTILTTLGISEAELIREITKANMELGTILLKDGHYEFHLRIDNRLSVIEDINNLIVPVNGQSYTMSDLAQVTMSPQQKRGSYLLNGEPAVNMAIRKKGSANNFSLRSNMSTLLQSFQEDYPHIDFSISNDQSEILNSSFESLKSSLLYGLLGASLVLLLFFRDWRLPLLIVISIPIGLTISLFLFYLLNISINIISLTGLILGIGLMIDNAIIIIENIKQHQNTKSLSNACQAGADEVIRPLISSTLTTCSVFLPLLMLSGLAGDLFYDQALSIAISLGSSLIVSYMILPVLANKILLPLSSHTHRHENPWHHRIVSYFLNKRWYVIITFLLLLVLCSYLFNNTNKTAFPDITRYRYQVSIDWNEPIGVAAGESRIRQLHAQWSDYITESNASIGELQYILTSKEHSISEAELVLHFKQAPEPAVINTFQDKLRSDYPIASVSILPYANVMDQLLQSDPVELYAHIQSLDQREVIDPAATNDFLHRLSAHGLHPPVPAFDENIEISIDWNKLQIYGVTYEAFIARLSSAFRHNIISHLYHSSERIPIQLHTSQDKDVDAIIATTMVENSKGHELPISFFINKHYKKYYKSINAGRSGERLSLAIGQYSNSAVEKVNTVAREMGELSVNFSGAYFQNQIIIKELVIVLLLVLVLIFLILAAQFESLVQPIIIILTLPVGILGALISLQLFDQSINIMSMVGIVILCGIDVNDAILKVDIFNRRRREGHTLIEAIYLGTEQRLRPIMMTSVTTILAMVPILFFSSLGAEIQRPLALALIGGLIIGTLASIILIPVFYYVIARDK